MQAKGKVTPRSFLALYARARRDIHLIRKMTLVVEETNFNDFYWHDAIISNIGIDRSNPGINDIISFDLQFIDIGKLRLTFEEVYWANLLLNFGVVTKENILHAYSTDDDDDLAHLYIQWRGFINDVPLTSYIFDLNSTGSKIKIIAKGFRMSKII